MNQQGFTLIEVLMALTIGTVLIGLSYTWIVTIEQISVEGDVLLHVLNLMHNDIVMWRNQDDLDSAVIDVKGVSIQRNVSMERISPYRERIHLSYRWYINGKPYSVQWQLDRFVTTTSM